MGFPDEYLQWRQNMQWKDLGDIIATSLRSQLLREMEYEHRPITKGEDDEAEPTKSGGTA